MVKTIAYNVTAKMSNGHVKKCLHEGYKVRMALEDFNGRNGFKFPEGTVVNYSMMESMYTLQMKPEFQKGNVKQMSNAKWNTTDLYEVKLDGNTEYGHWLATNSAGQQVFEIKGSGRTVAVKTSDAKKVLPFSVGVKFIQSSNYKSSLSKQYNYLLEREQAAELKVGDTMLILNAPSGFSLVVVTELDTQSEEATKPLEAFKIEGKLVGIDALKEAGE